MKKTHKIVISLVVLSILMITLFSTFAFAAGVSQSAGDLLKTNPGDVAGANSMKTLAGYVLYAIQWAGIVFGIILFIWFGIQWMTGGAAKKAALKGELWYYLIGLVLLFGASAIANIVYNAVKGSIG